jgi:RNA polymerase sigma-70 factor (ECF subfamily)
VDRERELALIKAVQNGNPEAFGELYNANVDRVYRYIYARVASTEVAQDLTADVFLKVLETLPTYQVREIPLLGWMYHVAHSRVIDYYRRGRQKFPHYDIDNVAASTEGNVDDALLFEQEAKRIGRALLQLSPDQQQVIILRFVEGHNLETTALLLNKTVGSVKVIQYRATQRLAQLLDDRELSHPEQLGILGSSL